jgi:UDP-glucose 4-epimerase
MSEILITGGAGNFGRTLSRALHEQGHSLRILDLPSCDFSFFQKWEKTFIVSGDILENSTLKKAVDGVDMVFHLAAVLPPLSEVDRDRTFRVNVEGTKRLIDVCAASEVSPKFVFASSVSVYGDTSQETELIRPNHPVNPTDWYAESKVEAEQLLMASGLPFVNLRISAISIPAFLDPPEPWPFRPEQRIELVVLSDLVGAMTSLVAADTFLGDTLIIAGGQSWQVSGRDYVKKWGEIMDIPMADMGFLDRPGWLNWYDTSDSQALLGYQKTSLDVFFGQLESAVKEALS